MDRYEILILTIPELTKDEESSLEKQLEKFLNEHQGSIISFDRWGKYRLSYPVRNNDYGVYFLMRFEVANDKDFLKELRNLFYVKFNDRVMRHIVTRLKKEGTLEYKKPPSLEDIPKKSIGFFDKKNKYDKPKSSAPTFKELEDEAEGELEVDAGEEVVASSDHDMSASTKEKKELAINLDNNENEEKIEEPAKQVEQQELQKKTDIEQEV